VDIPKLTQGQLAAQLRQARRNQDVFVGRYVVAGTPGWHPLPSAGAGMRVFELEAFDPVGRKMDVGLGLGRDAADNHYVEFPEGFSAEQVELRYRVGVPAVYFGKPVAHGLAFEYPVDISAEVQEAMGLMGLSGREKDFREVLYKVVEYLRDFSLAVDGIRKDLYEFDAFAMRRMPA
jgi:hypothetical protein